VRVIEAVVGGLIGVVAAVVGSWSGWWLSRRQQRVADKAAERERQLALMQQLVVAAGELAAARKIHHETWESLESRLRAVGMAALEFFSEHHSRGRGWEGALAPAVRVTHAWNRGSLEAAAALAPHMTRVAAVGLPLGMVEDPAIAAAAQQLMDACLEDKGDEAICATSREFP
jgi:hypothetical protein